MASPSDYEKLGAFYLGRAVGEDGELAEEPVLYDAKDLTTHAVVLGMTGSGKTGLCISILEEAALDGIPAIAIDPKGDLGNLMLTFPSLSAAEFRPWIDEGEASRAGRTPDEHAKATADLWRKGLAEWGQDASRVQRFRDSVETGIYTPGSSAGRQITVLRSLSAPPPVLLEDGDALRERIQAAVSGLLALLGVNADPIQSRDHILVSNIVDRAWREGRDLDLPSLIRDIQSPPFEKVGVFDLESFYPATDRTDLAMTLNNLLASPGFAAWMEGEPLDIQRLLYTPEGKPRLSILSIAHLSESERMFFVTLLLNEVVAWMRTQPGTQSLRALLYMDEVFGYFPPTANPPSKGPMLTLLKQARAYGLGVILATQNPVDLDYKGLSNTGTWLLGRLQTERDKARVIEGLEGASAVSGASFDRGRMERLLAGLGKRVFLMNNVHEDEPLLFHTRWVLSYLRGPLTRQQIKLLEKDAPSSPAPVRPAAAAKPAQAPAPVAAPAKPAPAEIGQERPVLPAGIDERFARPSRLGASGATLVYRPSLRANASLRYALASAKVDEWKSLAVSVGLSDELTGSPWHDAVEVDAKGLQLDAEPRAGARFADLPAAAARAKSYPRWEKMLKTHLYREFALTLWKCKKPKAVSKPGETEGDFRVRVRQLLHEERDLTIEKLRKRYAPKLKRIQDRIRKAEDRLEREEAQYDSQKTQTAISIGATVLGALFGRKLGGTRSVGRATTAARGMSRAARERGDIGRAREEMDAQRENLEELEAEFESELGEVRDGGDADSIDFDELTVRPRKTDLGIDRLSLVWLPWWVGSDGIAEPGFDG